jgi:hypothetical protein
MPNNGVAPEPVSATFTIDSLFGVPLDFPIEISLQGKAKTLTLPEDDAFRFLSPGLKATLTNAENPANSIDLTITGSVTQTVREDGTVLTVYTGQNLLGDPSIIPGGGPDLVLVKGRFTTVHDSDGNLVQPLQGQGQIVDLILELA